MEKLQLSDSHLEIVGNLLNVSVKELSKYKQHFEVKKISLGQTIIEQTSKNELLYLFLSGDVRSRASIDKYEMMTLEIINKPTILGLLNLKLGYDYEFYTASSECVFVVISYQNFKKLTDKLKPIKEKIIKEITLQDISYLLNKNKTYFSIPNSSKEIRDYLNQLKKYSEFKIFKKELSLSKEFEWIKISNINYLENIDEESKDTDVFISLKDEILDKTPLIGFPKNLLKKGEEDIKKVLSTKQIRKNNNVEKKLKKDKKIIDQKHNLKSEEKIDSSLDNKEVEINKDTNQEENFNSKYKLINSKKGQVDEATACFRMLTKELNLPVKADVIRKILDEQSSNYQGEVSLQLCAAIAESFGLQTQIVKLPLTQVVRIETPSFIELFPKELAFVFESKDDSLIVGRPLKDNLEKMDSSSLYKVVDKETNGFNCLILKKTERTPQKNFGLGWFKPSIKKNKKQLIEVLVASIFIQLFQLMNPLIIQQIIDKVLGQNAVSTLPVLASLLVGFSIFENILTAVRTNLFIDTTNRIDISLGEQVIDHLLRLPLNYFDKRPVGELSSRIGELEQIREFLTGTALTVVLDALFSVIYIAVMLVYSWVLTIVALLVAPLLGLITFAMSPVIRNQLRIKANLNAKTQNHLVEVLTGIQTVKAQNFELNARWKWKERYSKYISEGYKNAVTSTTANSIFAFLNQSSSLIVLCVGAYLVLRGSLTLGQLIAFRIISGYVTGPLLRLSNLYQSFQQTTISLERLGDILNTEQESTIINKKNIPMKKIKGNVIMKDVSFGFDPKGTLQVTQANLKVEAGQFVAIVGSSGSGKSTLTKLIPRLYEPASGTITIDGYDISKVELYSLRRQIGMIPQDSLLFEGSIQENIALTNPDASSEKIIKAAKVASAHDFIMSLSSGYSSPVGERGTGLSGGQRQRIAIARTVLQNPDLLIMDEATSALDYETERKVSLNIMEFFRGKTVFFITHRIRSITHADKIVCMHNSIIEEVGTHSELMSKKGRYYALYSTQSES